MASPHHIKFTQLAVERLPPPEAGRVVYFDILLPGFGLRVGAPRRSGHVRKTWVAFYRVAGKLVMETIGPMTLIEKVEDARERARESMRKAAEGVNPVEERRGKKKSRTDDVDSSTAKKDPSLLIPVVIDRYLVKFETGKARNGKPRRPNTIELEKWCLRPLKIWQPYTIADEVEVGDGENWSRRYFDELTRDDVKRYCETKGDEGHEVMANRSHSAIKRMFKWGQEEKIIAVNPIADLPMPYPEASRERWLSDAEIRAFWWACDEMGYPYGPIYQLLLLTATRLREVAELPVKGELDADARLWTLPGARTKPGRTFLVYLTDLAMDIINRLPRFVDSEFIFIGAEGAVVSAFSVPKAKLDELMIARLKRDGHLGDHDELEHWRIHDLRHTAMTNFGRLRIEEKIAERLLNHKLPGIQGVYNHWHYFEEKKQALERWCDLVESIIRAK
jgi:integrase